MRILLTGGGTGGHILPTLAVAAALKDKLPKAQFLYIGLNSPKERELVESYGFKFRGISAGKLRRYFSIQNVIDLFKFWRGIGEAGRIIDEFKPDVVFGKGGYVSLPVIMAAGRRKIPIIVQESDAVFGLANRLGMKWAKKVAVSFPVENYLKNASNSAQWRNKLIFTGLPVANDLFAKDTFTFFKSRRPTIFLTGGSQGSLALNRLLWQILPELLQKYNVIHHTGIKGYREAEGVKAELSRELSDRYFIFDFARREMVSALRQADIVLARSGSTIFELEVLGKPAILVPLPGSAGDHQTSNAKFLARKGAAVMVKQNEMNPEKLKALLDKLLKDTTKRKQMSQKMKELGKGSVGAAERIADLIMQYV